MQGDDISLILNQLFRTCVFRRYVDVNKLCFKKISQTVNEEPAESK